MRKNIIKYIPILTLFLYSCYSDKGNYDYKDIQELTIEAMDYETFTVGDTLEINPKITPDIPENSDRYSFKWSFMGKTRDNWNTKNITWKIDVMTDESEDLVLEITDNQTGVKYIQTKSCDIVSEFTSYYAWIILSDNNNESELSFIKYNKMDSRPDPVIPSQSVSIPKDQVVYKNVYKERNGESLGTGPIAIQEHFIKSNRSQYMIMQKSGAVDVDGNYMTKDLTYESLFVGDSYPSNFGYISGGSIMQHFSVITDDKGKIYTSYKFDDRIYHAGSFDQEPIQYNDKVMENCEVYRLPYSYGKFTTILSKDDGKIYLIFDGGNGDAFGNNIHMNAGVIKEIPNPNPTMPANYRSYSDFKNCKVYGMQTRGINWKACLDVFYKDNITNKYYIQTTLVNKPYYGINIMVYTSDSHAYEIVGLPAEPSIMYVFQDANKHYLACAIGKDLYISDLADATGGQVVMSRYFTAESNITAIHSVQYNALRVAIGTEDGWFYDLDTQNAKNKTVGITDEQKILNKVGGFGKIVHLIQRKGTNHENY